MPVYVPRAEANESSSSKTMIDGADCRALMEDLAEVLLALADPLALQLRPRDDGDGRADRRRHRLGEQRLAGARRPPEDHALGDQLLHPLDLLPVRQLLLAGQHVEDFVPAAGS